MKIDIKIIGGILLIVGTSLGGGMLALPIANAKVGFPISCAYLIVTWSVMTYAAFLILEVNLALPSGSNMISMAYETLGVVGRVITWLVYLFLLYILLSAYMAGGSDVFQSLFSILNIDLEHWQNLLIFVSVLGTVIISGISMVDHVNMALMTTKLSIYTVLIFFVSQKIHPAYLGFHDAQLHLEPIMVLVTSFGFAIIVPSLREYFNGDIIKLRRVILIGSIIPLVCYILWDAVIMGVVPRTGDGGLIQIMHSQHTTVELTNAINQRLQSSWIISLFRSFTALSMLTTFLGVGLCLVDFLADGLRVNKRGSQAIAIYALAFVPPLVVVLFRPDAFLYAIDYAGIFVVLLLINLPIMMAWSARYRVKLTSPYRVAGGVGTLVLVAAFSVLLLIIGLIYRI